MHEYFETGGAFADTPLLFFCDHASNEIPADFDNLGLSEQELNSHIALDIGAGEVTRALARAFHTRAAFAKYSRLLIDPNRSMDRDDFIPCVSDGVRIPGNENLKASEREERVDRFFEPYHHCLAREIDAACASFADPLFVSVHSFTPKMLSEPELRPWEMAVLWAFDEPSARKFMAALSQYAPQFQVGDNEPYDARGFNYTVDRHIKPLRKRHLTLEVRQDLISDPAGVARISALLEKAIRDLL